MDTKEKQKSKSSHKKKERAEKIRGLLVIPYVKDLSETLGKVFRKYGIQTIEKPGMILHLLVLQKISRHI